MKIQCINPCWSPCPLDVIKHKHTSQPSLITYLGPTCDIVDQDQRTYSPTYAADKYLIVASYERFVTDLAVDGSYCDMLSVLALSSVVHKAIQTLWPIMVNIGEHSPLTKLVLGRNVQSTTNPICILWTAAAYDAASSSIEINHFVPLLKHCASMSSEPVCVRLTTLKRMRMKPCWLKEMMTTVNLFQPSLPFKLTASLTVTTTETWMAMCHSVTAFHPGNSQLVF